DSELRVAELAFVENSLALLAAVLMGFGIYLVVFSKACPICAEKVTRAASDCHSCGHVFKSSTHLPDQRRGSKDYGDSIPERKSPRHLRNKTRVKRNRKEKHLLFTPTAVAR
ncbi:MAG: hypothetical protein ACTHMB_11680, partial [Candidatus Binatia bacterium]